MNDLFPESQQKSPYLEFLERHGIVANYEQDSHPQGLDWYAFIGSADWKVDPKANAKSLNFGFGETEKKAVLDLATKLNLDGWEKVNW